MEAQTKRFWQQDKNPNFNILLPWKRKSSEVPDLLH